MMRPDAKVQKVYRKCSINPVRQDGVYGALTLWQ